MESDTEKVLIEHAQAGDQSAYRSLFDIYRPRIYRIVNYILRNDADTEDVVQDIFFKMFKALGTFRHDSAFFTWLYKIAVNTARSSLTAKARDAQIVVDSDNEAVEHNFFSEADQPEVQHIRNETANMLELAINSLPLILRESFLLREIDGLSYSEIAELMRCPVGTVKSRISRAKLFLANRIAGRAGPR